MLLLNITRDVCKFLQHIERKHVGQIALKLIALLHDPASPDVKPLKGALGQYLRADAGEYRIIYRVEGSELQVILIGKRNDDEVYRELRRK